MRMRDHGHRRMVMEGRGVIAVMAVVGAAVVVAVEGNKRATVVVASRIIAAVVGARVAAEGKQRPEEAAVAVGRVAAIIRTAVVGRTVAV